MLSFTQAPFSIAHTRGSRKVSQVASALRDACPDVGANGGRHALSLKLAGALVSSELTWRVPDEHVPAFVYRACEEAGFGTLDQKWLNAIRTVALKRSGGAIAGWPSLRSEFPTVAAAVDPYYVEPLRGSAPAPPAAPPPASAPSALEADAPGFVGVPASALAAPLPRIEYIVRHFGIAKGRPTLLAGYGGLGKTIVAQALALHMAAGSGQCWGLPITSGPVWHFDYEMTLDPLQRRYQRLAYGYGLELKDCKLHVCSMPRIYLSDDEAEDALCRATDGLVLALVDNLAAATATSPHGENESNIRHYLDRLTRVTVRTGCQFLVLAHEKKGVQEGAHGLQKVRGSSAITDACGSVVSISVEPETGILTLAHNKASLREAGGDVCLKITDVDDRMRMPEDDPAGLRVERVDTVQRDVEAERRDRERDEAALERAKAEAVRVLREDPRGGLSRTQIQRLMRGDGKWKARAIELLVRDEVFIEAAGALSINR